MPKLQFKYLKGTPVFYIEETGENLGRPEGATLHMLKGIPTYYYPAYQPFGLEVVKDLRRYVLGIQFSSEALDHELYLQDLQRKLDLWHIDPHFTFTTAPYQAQKEGLAWLLYQPRAGLLFDCGLGKTKIVIDLIQYLIWVKDSTLRFNGKTLVLCPKNILDKWPEQVTLHSGGKLKAIAIKGTREEKLERLLLASQFDITVVTFDTNRRYLTEIQKLNFDICVADESFNLQTWEPSWKQSQRKTQIPNKTAGAISIGNQCSRRIILCGSATLGNPLNMYGQLRFMSPQSVPASYEQFLFNHTDRSARGKKVILGFKNLDFLNRQVTRFCLRRKLIECVDMPPRVIDTIKVEPSAEQARAYNEMAITLATTVDQWELNARHRAVALQKLMQITGGILLPQKPGRESCENCIHLMQCALEEIYPFTHACKVFPFTPELKPYRFPENPKLEALEEFLETQFQDPDRKVVVWAHFTEELNLIEEMLRRNKWGYLRIDGKNSQHAHNLSKVFSNTKASENPEAPGARIYLGQGSIAEGIDLHDSCSYSIDYSIDHSHKNWEQRLGRTFRIGQKHPTFHYVILMRGTVDETVYEALQTKTEIDTIITTRPDCLTCFRMQPCIAEGIFPFQPGCVFPTRVQKIKTRFKAIGK